MKERLVQYLVCPDCGGDLSLARNQREGDEIVDGDLACKGCKRFFPILRGVPRLLPMGLAHIATEVADGFGWQWNRFDEIDKPEYEVQLLDWLRPLGPPDFAGKKVIEGGCGKGRHTAIVAGWGAADVFAVDLGPAVEAAYRNTSHRPNVHVIQGDVTRLPLKRVADVAFSVGVLHHLPEPRAGFDSLADHVVPGGRVAVWVYGAEGNEWITTFVDPVRKRVTARMDRELLYRLTAPVGAAVSAVAKGIYRTARDHAPALHRRLFYREYMTYISQLTTRDIHNIVFDQLVTPVAFYLPKSEVEAWFDGPRFEGFHIEQHNGNSWRANARVHGVA
jgi:SAM-dependent methyltransferase